MLQRSATDSVLTEMLVPTLLLLELRCRVPAWRHGLYSGRHAEFFSCLVKDLLHVVAFLDWGS